MKHVAPHRWADLAGGRLTDAERAELLEHATGCQDCARARDRVLAAQGVLRRVGAAQPPALGWDLIGARLYWTVSSESRRRAREQGRVGRLFRRYAPFWGVGLALSGAAAVVLFWGSQARLSTPAVAIPVAPAPMSAAPAPVAPPAPAPTSLDSVVTFLQGDAKLGTARMTESTTLAVHDVITTGAGRVALQFGERSGFVVEPQSRVEVVAWSDIEIVLSVAGAVTVELEKRRPGQRFVVLAGARAVEVRGTVFRVAERDGDFDVAVTRGKVAVVEGTQSTEVQAPAHLALAAQAHVGTIVPQPLLKAAVEKLANGMHVPLLPVWSSGRQLRTESSMLSVAAPARARIAIDGREVATGPFLLRTRPGRYLVEAAGVARWVEVETGVSTSTAIVERSTSERPGQVDAQLARNRAAIGQCVAGLRKEVPDFRADWVVEIGIGADGAVNFVAPVQPLADGAAEACVLDVLRDRFTFPAGTKATVQKVIRF